VTITAGEGGARSEATSCKRHRKRRKPHALVPLQFLSLLPTQPYSLITGFVAALGYEKVDGGQVAVTKETIVKTMVVCCVGMIGSFVL